MAYELKTKRTKASVGRFLAGVEDDQKRKDCQTIRKIIKGVTGDSGRMWGASIIGFGSARYENTTGGGDWFVVGFSPRKQNITVYLWYGFDADKDLLGKLGPHKTGKACLYIKRLSDIDQDILKRLVERTVVRKNRDS